MVDSFEKIDVKICTTPKEGAIYAAKQVAALIRAKQASWEKCVLGLATGSTPIAMYAELVRMHRE
ncbi:MAG: glucosamine-6-phosphate deaminase, partial [Sediminibacterium sp.]